MKWAITILIVLGIVAALSASLLVNALRSENNATLSGSGEVKVVVAKSSLSAMSLITTQDIEIQKVSKKGLATDYFPDTIQVVGKVSAVPITKGQVITKSVLIGEGSGAQLAAVLPTGMRAISVPVSKHSVMGGLLYPGCIVDVIATFRLQWHEAKGEALSTTLLCGVQVLAVQDESIVSKTDEEQEKKKANSSSGDFTVTLMVDSRQAEALQLAMNNGNVTLAMRNPLDVKEVESDAMVLSQGRLAKLGQLLGPTVATDKGRISTFDKDGNLVLKDPNDSNGFAQQGSAENIFESTKRPQWQVTVIKGKEVKEEIFELDEPAVASQ
ncbi:MAG: Flp pilus assembly protein CpaB [Planctomycetes bacterium GWF2_42_9]|nr:MAG: Flp pilus assembly protein CpaB [Planctomycetes bacterium GWF2_42_9]